MIWSETSIFYISSTILYIVSLSLSDSVNNISCVYIQGGVTTLLYFLADNVFSKNRLTPRRIKIWYIHSIVTCDISQCTLHRVSLMCVVAVWSIMSVYLLVCAQTLEAAMESNVLSLTHNLVRDTTIY